VGELPQHFNFVFDEPLETLVSFEDLDSEAIGMGGSLRQFYFAAGSAAEGPSESVLSKLVGHMKL
jgi:hypothetical protein